MHVLTRRLVTGAVLVLAAVTAAPSSAGTGPATPAAASAAFVKGFVTSDPAACELMTARLRALVARIGRSPTCGAAFAAARAEDDAAADQDARRALRETVQRTQVLIDARAAGSGTRRAWIGPRFRAGALVADMRAHDIVVRLARGPGAARGTPTGLVFVDGARTTATTLVLYTESASGTIWRLTSATSRIGSPTRAARGVPARSAPKAQTFPYALAAGIDQPRVAVTTTTPDFGPTSFLLTLSSDSHVDRMLIGSLMTPLVPGTGAVDPAATIDRLMRAWERGDSSALCAELHPRLRLTDALFGSKCEVAEGRATVTRVTSPAFEGWSADGTMIVALRIEQGDAAATVHHVVTPVAGGSVVTGLFFDLDDLAETLLRPL